MVAPVIGWHFVRDNFELNLKHGNKRIKVKPGLVLRTNPAKLELCWNGLHASVNLFDAIKYAPGWKLCRVKSSGKIDSTYDKYVSTQREVIYIVDFKKVFDKWLINYINPLIDKFLASHKTKKFCGYNKKSERLINLLSSLVSKNTNIKNIFTQKLITEFNELYYYNDNIYVSLYRLLVQTINYYNPNNIRDIVNNYIEIYNLLEKRNNLFSTLKNYHSVQDEFLKIEMTEPRIKIR